MTFVCDICKKELPLEEKSNPPIKSESEEDIFKNVCKKCVEDIIEQWFKNAMSYPGN